MAVGVASGGNTRAGVSSTVVVTVCVITLGLGTPLGAGIAAVWSPGRRRLVVGVSSICNVVKDCQGTPSAEKLGKSRLFSVRLH